MLFGRPGGADGQSGTLGAVGSTHCIAVDNQSVDNNLAEGVQQRKYCSSVVGETSLNNEQCRKRGRSLRTVIVWQTDPHLPTSTDYIVLVAVSWVRNVEASSPAKVHD